MATCPRLGLAQRASSLHCTRETERERIGGPNKAWGNEYGGTWGRGAWAQQQGLAVDMDQGNRVCLLSWTMAGTPRRSSKTRIIRLVGLSSAKRKMWGNKKENRDTTGDRRW